MSKKVASVGLIPLVVLALLALAFVAPRGAFVPIRVASACPQGYTSCMCTHASITPPSSTKPAGTTQTWTASATGCPNPIFEFWIKFLNGHWYKKQSYSPTATFSWNSSGFPPGQYTVVVHVKQSGSTKTYEAYAVAKETLTGCTAATISQSSTTSHPGTDVTFTASSATCPNPIYRFWMRDTAGKWHLMQTGASNVFVWHNTGYGKGSYRIVVWANQNNSYMGRPQSYAFRDHTLN
jgi:cell wall-associated protease